MYKRVLSAEEVANGNQPFECGVDVLKAILQAIKELENYEIDVVDLGNGGVEITIGDSIYTIEEVL